MSRIFELHRRQEVNAPLADVFAFFERPDNLSRITPGDMGFVILTPPPLRTRDGAILDYVLRVLGVQIHWRTMITSYNPPHHFVDEQLLGPYLFWHHAHRFEETPNGCAIIDDVRYVMPFGPLGEIAHALFVKRQLTHIFDYRSRRISEMFGDSPSPQTGNSQVPKRKETTA